jgi:hypothetical protein
METVAVVRRTGWRMGRGSRAARGDVRGRRKFPSFSKGETIYQPTYFYQPSYFSFHQYVIQCFFVNFVFYV